MRRWWRRELKKLRRENIKIVEEGIKKLRKKTKLWRRE